MFSHRRTASYWIAPALVPTAFASSGGKSVRRTRGAVVIALIVGIVLLAGWRNSRVDPVVRAARVALPNWPAGASPVRVALLGDLHLGNASTDEARLTRVIAQVDRLRPDLVLIAGDLVAGYGAEAARTQADAIGRQLARLYPRLGTIAVLGNHDNGSDPALLARALRRAGVTVLENAAVRRGALLIGGAGDTVSGHARLGGVLNDMRRLERTGAGPRVYLSHSPDIIGWLPRGRSLLLAGHTHCGQVVLPLIGPLFKASRTHGNRYLCGVIRSGARTVIVSAGIGTSNVPIRFGAPPDLWLLTIGP